MSPLSLTGHSALQEKQTADAVRKRELVAKKEQELGQAMRARDTVLDRAPGIRSSITDVSGVHLDRVATAAQLEREVARFGDWLRSMERGNLSAQHALSDEEERTLRQHEGGVPTFTKLFELCLPGGEGWKPQDGENICTVIADFMRSEALKMVITKTTATAVSINKAHPKWRAFMLDSNLPQQCRGQVG